MPQPSIFQIPLWENYRKNIFVVIREALMILRNKPVLPTIEDHPKRHNLNRKLYGCFRDACYRRKLPFHLPTPGGKNPPYEGDIDPSERESYIPDFHWKLVDDQADEEFCERRFVLECKRLGKPSSKTWKLTENYVQNGIRRFITQPHEYGKGDDTCGMVGYVQNMTFDDILKEVNLTITQNSEPISLLSPPDEGWEEKGVSTMEHQLERSFPISPFHLKHFWVDLRR
jgi:hypothetical protein